MASNTETGFARPPFEINNDNVSETLNKDNELIRKIDDDHNTFNNYRLGVLAKKLIYAYGCLVLYFDEKDQNFKLCYNNGRGNCGIQDYGSLVLMEDVKGTTATYAYSLRDTPISSTEDIESGKKISIVLEQGDYDKEIVFIRKGNERIYLSKNDSDLLLANILKRLKKEDDRTVELSKNKLSEYNYYTAIKSFEETVREYDLNKILEDLYVFVEEDFVSRVGKDDEYYVYKTVSIGYPENELDDYLKDYIGIGKKCIYEARGYTSASSMAIKGLIKGEYNAEDLNKERERLVSGYSAQEHIYYLLYQYVAKSIHPDNLMYPKHVSNAVSIERNSLLPFLWRFLRSKELMKLIDRIDNSNSHREIDVNSLAEINHILEEYSQQIKGFREIECLESDPQDSL